MTKSMPSKKMLSLADELRKASGPCFNWIFLTKEEVQKIDMVDPACPVVLGSSLMSVILITTEGDWDVDGLPGGTLDISLPPKKLAYTLLEKLRRSAESTLANYLGEDA